MKLKLNDNANAWLVEARETRIAAMRQARPMTRTPAQLGEGLIVRYRQGIGSQARQLTGRRQAAKHKEHGPTQARARPQKIEPHGLIHVQNTEGDEDRER